MKNYIFTLILVCLSAIGFSQQEDQTAPVFDVTRPNPKTAAQMNSMTRMVEGSEVWRDDTKTVWRYVNSTWIDTGSGGGGGTTYTAGVGLTLNGNAFDIDNPFTVTDESNLNTAFGWGDHALANYLTSADLSGYAEITASDASSQTFAKNINKFSNVQAGGAFIVQNSQNPQFDFTWDTVNDIFKIGNAPSTLLQWDEATDEWSLGGNRILTTLDGGGGGSADGSETKINPTATVTVAGTGTTADPYLLTASGGGVVQSVKEASEYSFLSTNTPAQNSTAMRAIIAANITDDFVKIRFPKGTFLFDGTVISFDGVDGLILEGQIGTTFQIDADEPIFDTREQGNVVKNLQIKNIKFKSIHDNASSDHLVNAGLIFFGGGILENCLIEDVVFEGSGSGTDLNGFKTANGTTTGLGDRYTKNLIFNRCRFENLGRMGIELFQSGTNADETLFDIYILNTVFDDIGLFGNHNIAVSLAGPGRGMFTKNVTFRNNVGVGFENVGPSYAFYTDTFLDSDVGRGFGISDPLETSKHITITNYYEREGRVTTTGNLESYFQNAEDITLNNWNSTSSISIGNGADGTTVTDFKMNGGSVYTDDQFGAVKFSGIVDGFLAKGVDFESDSNGNPLFVVSGNLQTNLLVEGGSFDRINSSLILNDNAGTSTIDFRNVDDTLGGVSQGYINDYLGGSAATIASQAEAEAGTENTKMMTPLRTAEAIAAQAAGGGGVSVIGSPNNKEIPIYDTSGNLRTDPDFVYDNQLILIGSSGRINIGGNNGRVLEVRNGDNSGLSNLDINANLIFSNSNWLMATGKVFTLDSQIWNAGTFDGSDIAVTQDALADAIASVGGGGGTDDQNASEVPYTDTNSLGETDVQGAVDALYPLIAQDAAQLATNPAVNGEVDVQASLEDLHARMVVEEAESGGGGMTAENLAKINNQNKVRYLDKTAGGSLTITDFETTTGTTYNGRQSVVRIQNGNPYEFDINDAVFVEGSKLIGHTIGTGSQATFYFNDGETKLFRDLAGNTGNQWVVPELSRCVAPMDENGIADIDCGTVSTRSFGPNLGPNQVVNGTFDTDTDWTKQGSASISGGEGIVVGAGNIAADQTFMVLYQDNVWNTTSAENVRVTFDAELISGNGDLQIGQRFSIVHTQTVTGTKTTYTFDHTTETAQAAWDWLSLGCPVGTTIHVDSFKVEKILNFLWWALFLMFGRLKKRKWHEKR